MSVKKRKWREDLVRTLRAWGIYRGCRPAFFWSVGLSSLGKAVSPYVTVWFTARLVSELAGGRDPVALRWDALALLLSSAALTLLNAILSHWKTVEEDSARRLVYQETYMKKWLEMDYPDVDSQAVYDQFSRITQTENFTGYGLLEAREQFEKTLTPVFQVVGGLALSVSLFQARVPEGSGVAFLNSPLFSAAVLAAMLAAAAFSPYCGDKRNAYVDRYVDEGRLSNRAFSFYGYMSGERQRAPDLRMYRQQENVCEVYFVRDKGFRPGSSIARSAKGPMGLWSAASAAVTVALTGVVYLYVCLKAWGGAFGLGEVTQYIGVATNLFLGISGLFKAAVDIRGNSPFLERLFEFLDIPNGMYQGSLTTEKRSDRKYDIEFRDVSFRYPGRADYALRHVSMRFRVGSRLAVVGPNGSGKTTFIKLLCRLYDPTEGQILLNGIDIRKYRYREYMDLFAVVFQDFKLLALPLGENVAARRDYDRERAADCLRKAGFGERLASMPQGLDTYLYKDLDKEGVEVSGGEAQKIAIARALYQDAPFIILDEPTAALDPVAEAEIYSKFNDIAGDKTAIYISHRLSSCKFCDEIAVFDGGAVVQQGRHEDLLAAENGLYHALWEAQAQYYTSEKG